MNGFLGREEKRIENIQRRSISVVHVSLGSVLQHFTVMLSETKHVWLFAVFVPRRNDPSFPAFPKLRLDWV